MSYYRALNLPNRRPGANIPGTRFFLFSEFSICQQKLDFLNMFGMEE